MRNQQSQCLETGVNTLHASPLVRVCNFPPQFSFPLSIVHHFDFKPGKKQNKKENEKNEMFCGETKCRWNWHHLLPAIVILVELFHLESFTFVGGSRIKWHFHWPQKNAQLKILSYFYCFRAKDYKKREDLLQFTANKQNSASLEQHLNRRETAVFIDQVTES